MDGRFRNDGVQIGVIVGPSIVIEVIVKKASNDANIPMDWCYVGGRGIVYAIGNEDHIDLAKRHLRMNMPQYDILHVKYL
jgi:hypothetical protein